MLLADRFAARVDGLLLAALVITGAAHRHASAFGAATGSIDAARSQPRGWLAIGLLAVVCTVVPIASFLLALPRVGPGTASILSTFETVVGVGLAALLLGESLGALQAAGAALVVGRGRRAAARARPLGSAPMTLPLAPPLLPQLARSRSSLPDEPGWAFEPKWDGFRAIVFVDGDEAEIRSRNDRPLTRYFPELRFPPGPLRDRRRDRRARRARARGLRRARPARSTRPPRGSRG